MLILWIVLGLIALVALIAYICFRMAFYADRNSQSDSLPIPEGPAYEPYREQIKKWMEEVKTIPHEDVQITSFDGLTLRGRYYEYAPGATIELMFHGYRGKADRDLCGGVQRCFALGRSALIVDQRACGASEGNVITFGIRERRDCRSWVDFMLQHFGPDVKIIITGISMGASTVLMAAGEDLPENVIGALADCGFTSAKAIIQSVIRQMKLPPKLAWPFVKLGAWLYGGFDIEETSAIEAMARCKIPVILFHGQADGFVPCYMSQENYDACVSRKQLVVIPEADHGLSYPAQPEAYLREAKNFFEQPGIS